MFHAYILFASGNKRLGHFGFDWNFAYCKDKVAISEQVIEARTSKWLNFSKNVYENPQHRLKIY